MEATFRMDFSDGEVAGLGVLNLRAESALLALRTFRYFFCEKRLPGQGVGGGLLLHLPSAEQFRRNAGRSSLRCSYFPAMVSAAWPVKRKML